MSIMIPVREVLFGRENRRIKSALGAKAPSIEHVGSTSVPGLPAKPIIDILPSGEARLPPRNLKDLLA